MKAGDADLDAGEDQANLGMPPTSNAPLDIRAVANSGLAIIAPLHLLLLGPLSIGALAVVCSSDARWKSIPAIQSAGGYYSDRVNVPMNLVSAARAASVPGEVISAPSIPGVHHIPALRIRRNDPQLQEVTVDRPLVPDSELPNVGSALPTGVPSPPQGLRITTSDGRVSSSPAAPGTPGTTPDGKRVNDKSQ
jgi:hypothetical protein